MVDKIVLNEDERDCLQELMNISFGTATAAISKIIDKFATLGIPNIQTVSSDELKEHLIEKFQSHKTFYISSQLINGDISGENLFIISEDSSINLVKELEIEDDEIEDEIKDIVLEITNILSSVTLSKLADLVKANISFSSPSIFFLKSIKDFHNHFEFDYEHIIIISTTLKFEEQSIEGELVIMTKKESADFLKTALNIVLDEL
jgi:chemotaxis protein CheC